MLQSHSSNGRAGLRTCLDNLQLEFSAVEPALGDLGGASFARHGVHDVHRAHYLNSKARSERSVETNQQPCCHQPHSQRRKRPAIPDQHS